MPVQDNEKNKVSFNEFAPADYTAWRAAAEKTLKGADFEKKLTTKTFEGIVLQPIYNEQDVQETSALPGQPGYRRGVFASGYEAAPCQNLPYVTEGNPQRANIAIRTALENGADGVRIILHSCALGALENTNNEGVCVLTKEDVQALFSGIDLSTCQIHIAAGASVLPLLALLAQANLPLAQLRGFVLADPLGSLASCGRTPRALDALYDEMVLAIAFAKAQAPGLRTVQCSDAPFAAAGADSVSQLAYTMAELSEYLEALTTRGVPIDEAAQSICLNLSVGADFFMEMAKLRAARVLFGHIVQAYGGSSEAQKAHIVAQNSTFNKTLYDPYVNVLRTSTEAFSAMMGSAEALSILPFDARLGQSDEQATRLARNIPIILRDEFDLFSPVDPAGGSWYVETLTNQVIEASFELFSGIEAQGGFSKSLLSGQIQEAVSTVLGAKKSRLNTRALSMVGINQYPNIDESLLVRSSYASPNITISPLESDLTADFASLQAAFEKGANLPSVLAALSTSDAPACLALTPHFLSEDFEALRESTCKAGGVPVFLANMGPLSQHKARADFSKAFFEVGGFTVESPEGFANTQDAAAAACASGAKFCVICSTDASYPELVPALTQAITTQNSDIKVLVAGLPSPENKEAYLNAGVWNFIHIRANCYEILKQILEQGGH